MQVSAEIRWFWANDSPLGLRNWFSDLHAHGFPAGGGETRVDSYLRDAGQAELSLKNRGGKKGVEVKGLVAVSANDLEVDPFSGQIEIWTKWTTEGLELSSNKLIAIQKQRWLRKFDTARSSPKEIALDAAEKPLENQDLPSLGCNVELTRVSLPNSEI